MSSTLQRSVTSIGIDVSKAKLDVALMFADQSHKSHQLDNTTEGITQLITLLQKQRTAETVPCVIESTGEYYLLSALMITQAGFQVKAINPLITKQFQKASVRNAKSDTIDALRLARIGIIDQDLPVFQPNKDSIIARKLVAYLAKLEKIHQQLSAIVKQIKESRKLLGNIVDISHTETALKELDKQMALIQSLIRKTAPKKAKLLADHMRGLSQDSIAVVLSALEDKSFNRKDQLVAFVGMDIAVRRSGKWKGKEKLSKRGNPYLRKKIFQIAWGLKQHNPIYQQYYHRLYHEQGKHYTAALTAVARKFLRFLHAYYWQETICPENIV